MTGYGKSVLELPEKKITIEIRSLNSKTLDLNTRIPSFYREKELEVRNIISEKIQRGKVDFAMQVELNPAARTQKLNADLIKQYIADFKEITPDVSEADLLPVVMRMPDVMNFSQDDLTEGEWNAIRNTILEAVNALNQYRNDEGNVLEKELVSYVNNIMSLLTEVEQYEGERIITIKERFGKKLEDLKVEIDQNRYEQEMIYFLEKLDVTEEKVRLKNNCEYFIQQINEEGSNGKKLGFISQEIGREINTLGSKSNHADMQKLVVQMKDELEKIKEQSLNVL
ncbi:YicC family protein [Faecalibacter macacae]|uniref:YicC family protein n=2 Tax=Faecalibacter macacae TaxID=1859289 RepID=A0A3L9MH60_9FLAO|nr:YicC family protein [Faecalibacter macacae]